jgi:Glycosyl hydrolase family 26
MKVHRLGSSLLSATVAVLVLTACSGVSHAAYPYRPATKAHPGHLSTPAAPPPARPAPLGVRTASYWGIYEPGGPASFRPVQRFAAFMGNRSPRIVLYFSGWGQPFEAAYARAARRHKAVTEVQIQPTDMSMSAIAAGRYDRYLRSYAGQVRAFRFPVIIGFGHEMNGFWYSWGFRHVRPSTWIAAWRHVVTVFRRQGADNVTWLWTVNIMAPGIPSPRPWWPGAAYVTWVGIDGYYYNAGDTFESVLGPTINEVRRFTHKPILAAETGIDFRAAPAAIPGLFHGIRARHLLGLVWFDANANHQWRLEGHPAAIAAFRRAVARMLTGGR